ncbi:HD domain-containing protein [Microgenomates group bacterium]|nr:HD domain-containing protein [Microgenomates group bacterium]
MESASYGFEHYQREANKNQARGFEVYIKTPQEEAARQADLAKLSALLPPLDLAPDEYTEILDHARETWILSNPHSGIFEGNAKQNPQRFRSPENGFAQEHHESNWDHSCKMILCYVNSSRYFPEAMGHFDRETVLKTILWHDTPEFLYGDIPIDQQTPELRQLKLERELEAMTKIINTSRLGSQAEIILEQYEKRETKEAILVKILDILSGQHSFVEALFACLPATSEDIKVATGMNTLEYMAYLFHNQLVRQREVFDRWNIRLMRQFGLNDYQPMTPEVKKQTRSKMGRSDFKKLYRLLQQAEMIGDSDNPLSPLFYTLAQNHHRYDRFIMELQHCIDHPDFAPKLKELKEKCDRGEVIGDLDLFCPL